MIIVYTTSIVEGEGQSSTEQIIHPARILAGFKDSMAWRVFLAIFFTAIPTTSFTR